MKKARRHRGVKNMTLRILLAIIVAVLLISATLGMTYASSLTEDLSPQGPPPMPVDHEGRTTCKVCHETRVGGAPGFPLSPDHTPFPDDYAMCSGCHQLVHTATPTPTPTPKPTITLEQCRTCHSGEYEKWRQSTHAKGDLDCFICHSGAEVVPHEKVAVDLAICGMCHGERFRMETPHNVTCDICHESHSQALNPDVDRLCNRCHSAEYQQWSVSAHGLNAVACEKCHIHADTGHVHRLSTVSSVLCSSCHTEEYQLEATHDINCADCHAPHTQHLKEEVAKLCDRCHDDVYQPWIVSAHGTAGIACDTCHPHTVGGHVHRWVNASSAACGQCHETFEQFKTSGMAGQNITCVNCHSPHAQEIRTPTISTLCGRCHSQTISPEYYFWNSSVHRAIGASCEMCHMYSSNGYVHNFTAPVHEACEQCHIVVPSHLSAIQYQTEEGIRKAEGNIAKAVGIIEKAKTVFGVSKNDPRLLEAEKLLSEARHLLDMIKGEKSRGFHDPILTHMLLTRAYDLSDRSRVITLESVGEQPTRLDIPIGIGAGSLLAAVAFLAYRRRRRRNHRL